MDIAWGIDYGTTNSAICVYDGSFRFVDLENGGHTIPSLMYVDRTYYPLFGEAARERFLADNENRTIRLERTDLGYIELDFGENAYESFDHTGFAPSPTTIDARVSAFTDQNLPGFLFASTKRLMGQSTTNSIRVFEKNFKLEAIVSSIIKNMCEIAGKTVSRATSIYTCVGRPVNYECGSAADRGRCNELAVTRMERALEYAGVDEYRFFLEPIAPVLTYLHEHDEKADDSILVIDFGGGTLDLSLVRKRGNELEILGNDGLSLGGDLITEKLTRDHVFPRMGLSERNLDILRANHNYLGEMVPDLLNWRTTYVLNQPKYFSRLSAAMKLIPDDAELLNRIRLLIRRNYSYNVFYRIESAKKQLSRATECTIELEAIDLSFVLTRSELERSMHRYLSDIEQALVKFCRNHGLRPDAVGRIVLTGGTSLIPCVQDRIESLFAGRVVSIDPFVSVVKGFALGAWLHARGKISLEERRITIDDI